ncbi:uncharacterized protein A4U43_C09F1410 [Asparagus officinalis]|uniref:Uncharacterized protein n=1 Tax=Asparagus officinalis TaxID=4686 RepID=A0A5P1E7Q8_ASPOF|nr:uncharacterized protein A4U43_C09F1410 [Asparagus officinalis]
MPPAPPPNATTPYRTCLDRLQVPDRRWMPNVELRPQRAPVATFVETKFATTTKLRLHPTRATSARGCAQLLGQGRARLRRRRVGGGLPQEPPARKSVRLSAAAKPTATMRWREAIIRSLTTA